MLLGINPLVLGGRGACFAATAIVTAPVIFTTAAGTGGPLLYNGTSATDHTGVTAYLLAVSYGLSVAATAAGSIGIAVGVTTAPTTTTAIDSSTNLHVGGQASKCSVFRVGTVSAAATAFIPVGTIGTGALTVYSNDDNFVHLGGLIEIPPGAFASVSVSATLSTAVMQLCLIWMELPNA